MQRRRISSYTRDYYSLLSLIFDPEKLTFIGGETGGNRLRYPLHHDIANSPL